MLSPVSHVSGSIPSLSLTDNARQDPYPFSSQVSMMAAKGESECNMKVNVIAQLELELTYIKAAVQHFSHHSMRILPIINHCYISTIII